MNPLIGPNNAPERIDKNIGPGIAND